ncbi:MAG: hypothetical protein IJ719_06115 [Clostridia bacterium]|nr:hypothetical protein [Clostridia bacterium]
MCEALDYIENKGKEIGIKEGIEIGMREGRDYAYLTGIPAVARNCGLSIQETMELLEVPIEDRERYAILLKE